MLLTINELSKKYGIKPGTISMRIHQTKNCRIPAIHKGRNTYVDEDVFLEMSKKVKRGRPKGSDVFEKNPYALKKLKEMAGKIPATILAKHLGYRPETIRKKIKQLGLPEYSCRTKERRNILPEYPDGEKFYRNYQAMYFFYSQLLYKKREEIYE